MQLLIIKILDRFFAALGLIILSPLIILFFLIGYFDTKSPFILQKRVGKEQKPFILIKFRTMAKETQSVATHLVDSQSVTNWGKFLRKTKLDELPQLINVIKGEMSLVGPRPCLLNQIELIEARAQLNIFSILPGVTGIAQINQVDMSDPKRLSLWDSKMLIASPLNIYFYCLFYTLIGKGQGDNVNTGS